MFCTRLTVPIVSKQIFDAVNVVIIVALQIVEEIVIDDVLILEGELRRLQTIREL